MYLADALNPFVEIFWRPINTENSFKKSDSLHGSRGDRYLSHSSRHTQVPVPATNFCLNGQIPAHNDVCSDFVFHSYLNFGSSSFTGCINPIGRRGFSSSGFLACSSANAVLMASSCARVLSLMSF